MTHHTKQTAIAPLISARGFDGRWYPGRVAYAGDVDKVPDGCEWEQYDPDKSTFIIGLNCITGPVGFGVPVLIRPGPWAKRLAAALAACGYGDVGVEGQWK